MRECKLMGILNVTPDSFFDGGKYTRLDQAIKQADQMVEEGADFLDIGGESTRPGSLPVAFDEELRRVLPVVKALKKRLPSIPLSIDTQKAEIASQALEEGAEIINDVSALSDPRMGPAVKKFGARLILMHMQGAPRHMQMAPKYKNVVREVKLFLAGKIEQALHFGIRKEKIWIDPGIGFGKTPEHNVQLLSQLRSFLSLGVPILVGASRKSFIGLFSAGKGPSLPADQRLEGSIAAACWAALQGASVLRVHDCGATKKALSVLNAISKKAA